MGQTTRYRFRQYGITPDPMTVAEFSAVCVSDLRASDHDSPECGASSGELTDAAAVTRWIAEHLRDTGHPNYRQTTSVGITAEPGEWQ